ncbi:hypothetical protein L1987_76963 [Smallanthus sonchifolius]|uniref:Uncharacterized protein n=1 Tax=Smallanthus sonchifolius TaxID=185202 RepID=A0ACB8Z9P1_9ASTR|nr:hypothetical protein L1987_76963 [Smallanthus sonchifolius]
MSGQQVPPSRPWLRLATMRPPPQPAAPSNQAPPPTVIRPTFTPTVPPPQPTPPPPPPQQPTPTPQLPTPTPSPPRPTLSPVPATNVMKPPALSPPPSFSVPSTSPSRQPPSKAASSPPRTTIPVSTTRAVTPPSSPPKILKPLQQTPPPLPPTNPATRQASPPSRSPPKKSHLIPSPPSSPPKNISPLVLPSLKQKPFDDNSPPEYNQKTIHVQEKPKTSSTAFNGGGVHAHNSTRKPETHRKHWDSEDAGKNIITIAGENKGAIMNITPLSDKQHDFSNNRHKPTTSNNGETDSDAKNKNQNSDSLLKTSFLNSNVQGVNNSIIFNCSISHHDPGIHLALSTKSDRDSGFHSKEIKKG